MSKRRQLKFNQLHGLLLFCNEILKVTVNDKECIENLAEALFQLLLVSRSWPLVIRSVYNEIIPKIKHFVSKDAHQNFRGRDSLLKNGDHLDMLNLLEFSILIKDDNHHHFTMSPHRKQYLQWLSKNYSRLRYAQLVF